MAKGKKAIIDWREIEDEATKLIKLEARELIFKRSKNERRV